MQSSHENSRNKSKQHHITFGPEVPTGPSKKSQMQPFSGSTRPAINLQNGWMNWSDLTINIHGLRKNITALDLYKELAREGQIIKIKISRGTRASSANVIFSPPPRRELWKYFGLPGSFGLHPSKAVIRLQPGGQMNVPCPVHSGMHYPSKVYSSATQIDFGFFVEENAMMIMHTVTNLPNSSIHVCLNLKRRLLEIAFPCSLAISKNMQQKHNQLSTSSRFRFTIYLDRIGQFYEIPSQVDQAVVFLVVESPPVYYRQMSNIHSTFANANDWSEQPTWLRQTDIMDHEDRVAQMRSPYMIIKRNPVIDIGRWNTFKLYFDLSSPSEKAKFEKMKKALRDFNVPVKTGRDMRSQIKTAPKFLQTFSKDTANTSRIIDQLGDNRIHLPYAVQYQLESCISQGYLNEHNIDREFMARLQSLEDYDSCFLLEKVVEEKKRIFEPRQIFSWLKRTKCSRNIPHYCVLVRSVTVTPSCIIVNSPVVETSNRTIRQYIEYQDRFLRVKFLDEIAAGKINGRDDDTMDEVFSRVKHVLQNGLVIAGRHFEFLAFGNSQFRENGAYFFAATNDVTAESIRRWMGDFSHIKSVSRYAARLGQCFSTTRAVSNIKIRVRTLSDLERGNYCFTDGVGRISPFLARMIASMFFQNVTDVPSVFQIRLGGCKGIVVVDPDTYGNEVRIRKSQYKFPAIHEALEIVRYSTLVSPLLNRQLIVVLSALGVPDYIFKKKLEDELANLKAAMNDETIALSELNLKIDINKMTLNIASMISFGFMRHKEPFFTTLLNLWRSWSTKGLKEKARIYIPQGAFVLGCIDETSSLSGHFNETQSESASNSERLATLPEIFLQISDLENPGRYKVVQGICFVARNPSLHAGDIRVVKAVDCALLRHIKNAVVFPSTGDRDIPSMCSGGDLDGDDYIVIWDQDLLPREINHPSMDFTPPGEILVRGNVTVDQLTSFFVTYMKNDSLSRIATAHLAHADLQPDGVKSRQCLKLAALHSYAVDYPKSGIPARMDPDVRVSRWPHFMEKTHLPEEQNYKSNRVLGKLYDMVERIDFTPAYELPFDKRILEAYDLDEETLKKALGIKRQYDISMRRIMAQHDVRTEFEVWSTFVLYHNKESSNYKFAEVIGKAKEILVETYQEICVDEAGSPYEEKIGPFVAAMYTVTAHEVEQALKKKNALYSSQTAEPKNNKFEMPLISFPWIFERELGKIANGIVTSRHEVSQSEIGTEKSSGNDFLNQKHPEELEVKTVTNTADSDIKEAALGDQLKRSGGETVDKRVSEATSHSSNESVDEDILELAELSSGGDGESHSDVEKSESTSATEDKSNLRETSSSVEETMVEDNSDDSDNESDSSDQSMYTAYSSFSRVSYFNRLATKFVVSDKCDSVDEGT